MKSQQNIHTNKITANQFIDYSKAQSNDQDQYYKILFSDKKDNSFTSATNEMPPTKRHVIQHYTPNRHT